MQIKLSRGEFWILGIAINAGEGFASLAGSDEHISGYWNREPHGMDLDQLIESLCGMFERKWLQLNVNEPGTIQSFFVPDRDFVHDFFHGKIEERPDGGGVYFWLTHEGGRVWEEFAAPEWDRCFNASHQPGVDEHHEIIEVTAGSEDVLQNYLEYFPLDGSQIVDSSLKFEIIVPWQAKYWKELPQGFRATFQATVDWEKSFDRPNHALQGLRDCWVRWG
jgi:hypothetical protein